MAPTLRKLSSPSPSARLRRSRTAAETAWSSRAIRCLELDGEALGNRGTAPRPGRYGGGCRMDVTSLDAEALPHRDGSRPAEKPTRQLNRGVRRTQRVGLICHHRRTVRSGRRIQYRRIVRTFRQGGVRQPQQRSRPFLAGSAGHASRSWRRDHRPVETGSHGNAPDPGPLSRGRHRRALSHRCRALCLR